MPPSPSGIFISQNHKVINPKLNNQRIRIKEQLQLQSSSISNYPPWYLRDNVLLFSYSDVCSLPYFEVHLQYFSTLDSSRPLIPCPAWTDNLNKRMIKWKKIGNFPFKRMKILIWKINWFIISDRGRHNMRLLLVTV